MERYNLFSSEIAACRLFSGVDLEPLEHILQSCELVELEPTDQLIARGVSDDSLFLVLRGELDVHVDGPEDEPVACVCAGDSVGELAALDRKPRSAAVFARTPSTVMRIESEEFWRLMALSHQVALNMLHVLGQRLRGNNAKILDTRRLQELYRRNASTDPLTGLYNRRGLAETGERLLKRLAVNDAPLSLLMIDVDHFKRFNDEHGHQAGDFVLFAVAKLLKEGLRPTDFVARYGGEEFTVLLPETRLDGALIAAERVRESLRRTALKMPDGTSLPLITASFGVAELGAKRHLDTLIAQADKALYRAKRAGRDCVQAARSDSCGQ